MARIKKHQKLITAAFNDPKSADQASDAVVERSGYSRDDLTVLISDDVREEHYSDVDIEIEQGTKAAEGAGVGGATGGAIGGVAGALMAAGGSILLPGVGLAIAGPLAATMAGAGTGGAAGTIIGALVGAGIPEERAKRYEKDIKEGHIILGVHPHSEEDAREIVREWKDLGARRIQTGKYAFDTGPL